MKKLLAPSLALLLITAFVMPASAFVVVFGEIDKEKNIYVDQDVLITKYFDVTVTVESVGTFAAEADALVNQDNGGNFACENCAEKVSLIDLSVLNNIGITNANQATGNMNNQSNVVALAVDVQRPPGPPPPPVPPTQAGEGFSNSQSHVAQMTGFFALPCGEPTTFYIYDSTFTVLIDTIEVPGIRLIAAPNTVDSLAILQRDATITASVDNNVGITNVNQAAGQMANQANVSSIAACLDGSVSLAEADLGQATALSFVYESETLKTAWIGNSVNLNTGVTFVNQSSGNMANQANNLSLAVAVHQ